MTPRRDALPALARLAALAVVAAALLAPVGSLLVASLRETRVVTTDGRTMRVAGAITPLDETRYKIQVPSDTDPDADTTPVILREGTYRVEEGWTLAHYAGVFRSARTGPLLLHSLALAAGSALLALLLGIPAGFLVARTTLPGRRVFAVLLAAPLLMPPFFAAMGTSEWVGAALSAIGLRAGDLQIANGIVCLGALCCPIPALLVGRALAVVPRGAHDAALLLGGRGAARRHVVLPAALPAALAAFTLVFVIALCDFAVPDLLGVFLPKDAIPLHVYPTEVFLQWNKVHNTGRAVATGFPLLLVTGVLLVLAARLARKGSAAFGVGAEPRPLVRLSPLSVGLGWATAALVLGLSVALPIAGVAAWGFSPTRIPQTIRETAGLLDDFDRWIRLGLLSALLSTATAVVLARWALRGGRGGRAAASLAAGLPLAVPGITLMVGTLLLWVAVPTDPGTLWKGVLVLTARTLPYALLAAVLALREVDRGLEEAGATLGAGPVVRARRIWGPLSRRGWVSAFLLALVFALRELDGIVLIEAQIVPVRIYDKVHYGRVAQVADLSMAYLGVLLVPALLLALAWRRRPPGPVAA